MILCMVVILVLTWVAFDIGRNTGREEATAEYEDLMQTIR